jgi:deoxyinosine 3'endonuclease (endonuclease V)
MLNHTSSDASSIDVSKVSQWQAEQASLVKRLVFTPLAQPLRTVAGIDISFSPTSNQAVASLVILSYPPPSNGAVWPALYTDFYHAEMTEPYVAGYLGFREMSHMHALFQRLKNNRPELYPPGVTLVDGNGIWHPRGLGSASHLGVSLGIPTIGVAKTFYHLEHVGIGHDMMKGLTNGADREDIIGTNGLTYGAAIRTGGSTRHIFVSCGSMCDLESAVEVVRNSSMYRIPEPIRRADLESRRVIREEGI